MEKNYYLFDGKKKTGPFSIEELKNQKISQNFMVWCEGMTQWKNISEVADLITFVRKKVELPPPTPFEKENFKKRKLLRLTFKNSFVVFFIFGTLIFIAIGGISSNEYLKRLYPDNGFNPIYSTADELRYSILPLIAYIFVSLPIAILFFFLRFRYLSKMLNLIGSKSE